MELGGKNALVVCDDADLDRALEWALASAFSNAGQRCAAASRIVVFDGIFEEFRERLVALTARVEAGPVISEASLERALAAVDAARRRGAHVLAGGTRVGESGWHLAPTLLEDVPPDAPLSREELFAPVAALYRVAGLDEAVALVNDSSYGLTAAIHTASVHRALRFAELAETGVVVVNAGTHGSEPHMGFGGVKRSGTGWKEAGIEALDVYSRDPVRQPRGRSGGGVSGTRARTDASVGDGSRVLVRDPGLQRARDPGGALPPARPRARGARWAGRGGARGRRQHRRELRADALAPRARPARQARPPLAQLRPSAGADRGSRPRVRPSGHRDGRRPPGPSRGGARACAALARRVRGRLRRARQAHRRDEDEARSPRSSSTACSAG